MDSRLDGNTMAGLFGEIFPFDLTTVTILCSGCGSSDRAAEEIVYVDAPGMVMRCVHCDTVLIRVVHGGGRYWLDMRGVTVMQIPA